MDKKLFFDVFPTVKVNNELSDMFRSVEVRKAAMSPNGGLLKLCILSDHIIMHSDICKMQKAIEKAVFTSSETKVVILQRYELSDTYNLRVLMDVYRDSVVDELKAKDHMLWTTMRHADAEFASDDTMTLIIPDSRTNRTNEKNLVEFLEKIFTDRCGVDAKISVAYKEADSKSVNTNDEALIERKIAEIAARAGMKTEYSDTPSAEKVEVVTEEKQQPKNGKASAPKTEGERRRDLKHSDNPAVIYGKEFEGETIPISDVQGEMGEVVIRGQIIGTDSREIKNEKTIYFFDVSDFTDTIRLKVFIHNDQVKELSGGLKKGAFVKIKGIAMFDKFDGELTLGSIEGIMSIKDFRTPRVDLYPEKRVELHAHTKMSDMDGVSEVNDIVKKAYGWGHPAVAVTDHGVVQSFPIANHLWDDLWKAEKNKRIEAGEENPNPDDFFKVIYGVEAYLVDDLSEVAINSKGQMLDDTCVVFDIETTGFSCVKNKIIEIGAVKLSHGEIVSRFSKFVNPMEPIPYRITQLTSITDDMVSNADTIDTVLPEFLEFAKGAYLVAHNASFDTSFIAHNCETLGYEYDFSHVDTLEMGRILLPHLPNYKLHTVAKDLDVSLEHHHRAVDDAECTAGIYLKLIERAKEREITQISQLNNMEGDIVEKVKKLRPHHAIMLAKNNTGRVNLYHMVSESHLRFMHRGKPCIPKSLFNDFREGILLGSACEAGELYSALVEDRPEDEIAKLVEYYDYLEIQPVGNNAYMLVSDKHPNINTVSDIQELNKKVVELGDKFCKPVVATCDVHFLNPEDEVYRRIIMAGSGFKDADSQAPLFLRTTEEMLEEFMYLGSEKAREVVITNTVKIADMIDKISPVRPDKCPPVIEDSDKTLTEICYNKAHEMYGDPLPAIVEERLKRELHSIISNGFAVMYIIAQKLVWKSVEDGYLVGSRGSVGSSFVATMAGITEVNPLSPHYYCPNCHYVDFESEEVKSYAGKAGIDMPDKECPVCGQMLKKDGFDIPFETFLGFKGDKEPDIDLNFSSEYQSKAHKYVEVIFGAEQAFRAGTIATLADKTAYGYVKKYFEEHGVSKRGCEIDRIVQGCVGIRRSTGQHPGGIIVLPVGEDINSFTPVQHPPKDEATITTHFDYHSIDHNLLKLDILGHEDPTMIRKLQDLTGRDPLTIPLDDPGVMSLFQSTEALGITPADMGGTPLGCLGIPEFGTDFAMNMLLDTKPQAFSDLVRISGLSHGTNVWQGNAEVLIKEGKATISTAICTRDDIMTYLIEMGVESSHAFSIMENVRKGKVAKGKCGDWPGWKDEMMEHGVPDWYIWSCERIEYMFPKAHAAAYVMMAWRVAYCKINYPLQFYAAFFTIRAKAFSYELMCQGREHLEVCMAEVKRRIDNKENSKKDEDTLKDMRIVQEMYARGFEFMPIDVFRAEARNFQVIDGKIMPSLTSIEGLGESAAELIVDGVKGGPFLSKEDFRARTKASQTITDLMANLGLLGDIPESNQISIFDWM
ncbi:MAG: PolC-type DNA polymerase III [Lachnospiraceae bacterium]|nr:PolC-type DNA polymerase III [Candidatus Colinaster equi]